MNAEEIFYEALARPPAERGAFVAAAGAGDEALKRRLEALLRAHENPAGFLATRPFIAAATIDEPDSERLGTVIGPYKIIQQLGEGGFGVVFLAEQAEPVRRMVALKVIRPGMDTAQVIVRFESERQALVLMDHPNIAKVLDAGATASGRPYFVMELVKGVPITEFCDKNRLPLEARLRMFFTVCHAIQHAHHKGIIHRDIKPSNVLVTVLDGAPTVKVIDFGVAKAMVQKLTDKTLVTSFGQMIGTPIYMSPEQAETSRLDIDTRSDVYSLGVLLYELLTGTTPLEANRFREVGYRELQRLICEETPPWPSERLKSLADSATVLADKRELDVKRLTKLLAGDLGCIVMKALEKDRNRRYETPANFAEDIERYLRHEVIVARRPSAAYKLKMFARRNRASVVMVIVVVVAILAGTTLASWQAIRATQSSAAEKKAKELAQASDAESKAVLDFLERQILAAARPEGQDGGLGSDVTLRKALENALPHVEKGFPDQPLIQARLRLTLGSSFHYLGDDRLAVQQLELARALFSQHVGPDHQDTLASMNNLAASYTSLGRYSDAFRLLQEIRTLQQNKFGPTDPQTLRAMHNLAVSYAMLQQYDEARRLHEETLALRETVRGPDHPETLDSIYSLATTNTSLGHHEKALQLHQKALALRETSLPPNHPDTLRSRASVAASYGNLGRHEDAIKLGEETLKLQKAILPPNHADTLRTMHNLATDYFAINWRAKAVELGEETLKLRRINLAPGHPDTLDTMNRVANMYFNLGRYDAAIRLYQEALDWNKAASRPVDRQTLVMMHNLAAAYFAVHQDREALEWREETLKLRQAKLGTDDPDTLFSMAVLAESLLTRERGTEALAMVDECLRLASGKNVDSRLFPVALATRLRHFEKVKDAAGCRETAEMWEKQNRTDATSLYDAACMRAVTAAVIPRDPKTPDADASRLAKEEADRAISWLQQAVAAGFKDAALLAKDPDLNTLRDRDGFKKLLSEMKK